MPIDHVIAIYARENGQGMAFPMPAGANTGGGTVQDQPDANAPVRPVVARGGPRLARSEGVTPKGPRGGDVTAADPPSPEPPPKRPSLKRVK